MKNEPVQRRRLPGVLLGLGALLWGLMCGVMLLSAILGLVCFVVGLLSFLVQRWPLELYLGGVLVQTTVQKALFTLTGAALGIIAIGFWWLWRRDYIVGAVVLYAAVVVFVLAFAWATGRNELLSIGWSGG
jgi:hypothetical protein